MSSEEKGILLSEKEESNSDEGSNEDDSFTSDSESESSSESDKEIKITPSTSKSSKLAIISSSSESSDSENSKEMCAICLGKIKGVIGSPELCDHSFCLECILEWSKTNNSCPQDRTQFLQLFVRKKVGGRIVRRIDVDVVKPEEFVDAEEEDEPTFCEVCGRCDREDTLLLCDGCDSGYHLECLVPPLAAVPTNDWFCSECQAVNQQTNSTEVMEEVEISELTELLDDAADIQNIDGTTRTARTRNLNRGTRGSGRLTRTRAIQRVRQRITRARNQRGDAFFSLSDETEESSESDAESDIESEEETTTIIKEKTIRKKTGTTKRKRRKTTVKRKRKTTKTTTKKRKTKTRKRKTRRKKRTTKKKTGAKKVVRRKRRVVKGKRKSCKSKTVPVVTPKARLAEALGIRPMKNKWQLSVPKMTKSIGDEISNLTDQRWRAGVPSLSLLGSSELDILSEPDEYGDAILAAGVRRNRTVSTSALLRRKAQIGATLGVESLAEAPPVPSNADSNGTSVGNILDNIIESQNILHNLKSNPTPLPKDGTEYAITAVYGRGGRGGYQPYRGGPGGFRGHYSSNYDYGFRYGGSSNNSNFSQSNIYSRPSWPGRGQGFDPTGSKAYSIYLNQNVSPVKSKEEKEKDSEKEKKNEQPQTEPAPKVMLKPKEDETEPEPQTNEASKIMLKPKDDDQIEPEVDLYSDIEPENVDTDTDLSDEPIYDQSSTNVEQTQNNQPVEKGGESPLSEDGLVIDDNAPQDEPESNIPLPPSPITFPATFDDSDKKRDSDIKIDLSENENSNSIDYDQISDSGSVSCSFSLSDLDTGDPDDTTITNEVESDLKSRREAEIKFKRQESEEFKNIANKFHDVDMRARGTRGEVEIEMPFNLSFSNEEKNCNLPFNLEKDSDMRMEKTQMNDVTMPLNISFKNEEDSDMRFTNNELDCEMPLVLNQKDQEDSDMRVQNIEDSDMRVKTTEINKGSQLYDPLETEIISDSDDNLFEDNIEEGEIPSELPAPARPLPAARPKIHLQLRKFEVASFVNKEFDDNDCEEGEIRDDEAIRRERREKAKRDVDEVVKNQFEVEEVQVIVEEKDDNVVIEEKVEVEAVANEEKVEEKKDGKEEEKDGKVAKSASPIPSTKNSEKEKKKEKKLLDIKTVDSEDNDDVAFKKISRKNKTRNYREEGEQWNKIKSPKERPEPREIRERPDARELRDRLDPREMLRGRPDPKQIRERPDPREARERLDHRELRDRPDPRELRDRPDPRELRDRVRENEIRERRREDQNERSREADLRGERNPENRFNMDKRNEKERIMRERERGITKKDNKRSELPRYDVREIINKREEERRRKDEFGRDIALRGRSRSKSRGRKRKLDERSKPPQSKLFQLDKPKKRIPHSRSRSKSRQKLHKSAEVRSKPREHESKSRQKRPRRRSYSTSSTSTSSSSSTSSSYTSTLSSSSSSRSRSRRRSRMKKVHKSRSRSPIKKQRDKKIEKPKRQIAPKNRMPVILEPPSRTIVKEKNMQPPSPVIVRERKRENKPEANKVEKAKKKRRREKSPQQSKAVYQAGGSIMVSVNFSRSNASKEKKKDFTENSQDSAKLSQLPWSPTQDRVSHPESTDAQHTPLQDEPMWSPRENISRPVEKTVNNTDEIIMLTPPLDEPILITDSEDEVGVTRLPPDLGELQSSPLSRNQGPKTPPEPGVKFTVLSTNQVVNTANPLQENEEIIESIPVIVSKGPSTPPNIPIITRGPNTPPGAPPESDESTGRNKSPMPESPRSAMSAPSPEPDVYDPFEPTKTPSPPRSPQQEARVSSSDQAETNHISKSPIIISSPVKGKAHSRSSGPSPQIDLTRDDKTPKSSDHNAENEATSTVLPLNIVSSSATQQSVLATPASMQTQLNSIAPKLVASPTQATPSQQVNAMQQLFAGLPANVANILYPAALAAAAMQGGSANLLPPPPLPDFSRPPPPTAAMLKRFSGKHKPQHNGKNETEDGTSPNSPDSSDISDMFDPPSLNASDEKRKSKSKKISPTKQSTPMSKFDNLFGPSTPNKNKSPLKAKKHGKKVEIEDDVPNSAVDLQVKERLIKKVQRQERVVEEVKVCLKPFYSKKTITKEDYKDIMKKCVSKVCHTRSGEINPIKIQHLVDGYVKKVKYYRKKFGRNVHGGVLSLKSGMFPPAVNPAHKSRSKTTRKGNFFEAQN